MPARAHKCCFLFVGQEFRVAKYREVPIGGHESAGILVVRLALFAYHIDSGVPAGELVSRIDRERISCPVIQGST